MYNTISDRKQRHNKDRWSVEIAPILEAHQDWSNPSMHDQKSRGALVSKPTPKECGKVEVSIAHLYWVGIIGLVSSSRKLYWLKNTKITLQAKNSSSSISTISWASQSHK